MNVIHLIKLGNIITCSNHVKGVSASQFIRDRFDFIFRDLAKPSGIFLIWNLRRRVKTSIFL